MKIQIYKNTFGKYCLKKMGIVILTVTLLEMSGCTVLEEKEPERVLKIVSYDDTTENVILMPMEKTERQHLYIEVLYDKDGTKYLVYQTGTVIVEPVTNDMITVPEKVIAVRDGYVIIEMNTIEGISYTVGYYHKEEKRIERTMKQLYQQISYGEDFYENPVFNCIEEKMDGRTVETLRDAYNTVVEPLSIMVR